jgi:hypothetical protein
MIFSITDIVISGTLFLNALALVATKSSNADTLEELTSKFSERDAEEREDSHSTEMMDDRIDSIGVLDHLSKIYYSIFGHNSAIMLQFRRWMVTIRLYSCIIAVWNIFFMLLMVFVFR